jgi:glycosyltransferase involved in cell wall biosynthesis
MRFHVVGLPHTNTTRAYETCAFTANVRKFCDMMHARGHVVYLYAGEENEAACTELIPCVTRQQQKEWGFHGPDDSLKVSYDPGPIWRSMNTQAARQINQRAEKEDFLCLISGSQWPISEELPHLAAVEYAAGYLGIRAPYRVFPSYAWMHAVYGDRYNAYDYDPSDFDAVIPHFFNPDEFPLQTEKDDYFLYIGRLTERKGWRIAQDVCERTGSRLLVAGRPEPGQQFDGYGEYLGVLGSVDRAAVVGGARAIFMPTRYIEPFGCVAAEALLCGTPVISSDTGGATEIVRHGYNGWRCRSLRDYMQAVDVALQTGAFDYEEIHLDARARYNMSTVGAQYQQYFEKLADGRGWYAL